MQEKLQALLLKVCAGTATVEERREMTRLSLKVADLPKQTREDLRAAKVSRLVTREAGRILAILHPIRKLANMGQSLNDQSVMDLIGAIEVYTGAALGSEQFETARSIASKRILHREANPIVRRKKAKVA
jgi:hypothetical protein